jgi:DNA polymerase-2
MAYTGFIVHATTTVEDDHPFIVLYGRLTNNESFKALVPYAPYFFIKECDVEQARPLIEGTISPHDGHTFDDEPVVKVTVSLPASIRRLRTVLEEKGIECYEADIKFEMRYLIDMDIRGFITLQGPSHSDGRVDHVFISPTVAAAERHELDLRLLSIDIETSEQGLDDTSSPIYSIGLYGDGIEEVLFNGASCEGATACADEKLLLQSFRRRILNHDPDVIVGWNIVDFDMHYLAKRFKAHGMPFDIGRSEAALHLRTESSFIRASRAQVEGRMVLDGMHLLRDYFYRFDDYRLDTAARELIGDEKLRFDGDMTELYERDPSMLARYNLHDAYLVYRILKEERLIELTMMLSTLTGMQMDRVKASIATLDSLYLRRARSLSIICPSVKGGTRMAVTGGYVEEPDVGIYDHVLLCDFRSLYPSIIATFNIDPLTFEKGDICAPNGACFGTGTSVIPALVLELLKERQVAKAGGEYTKQFAIKIIMNSIFGVLGNPNCRFYNSDVANAVTAFGRQIIQNTATVVERMGYHVIYGDTDSIFVLSRADDTEGALQVGQRIEQEINVFYKDYIWRHYHRQNHIHLEFETHFERFYLPRQRHDDKGAKKRYAGLVDGELRIVGLEYVRRDWTQLAKEFQYELLRKVFFDEDYQSFIRDYVRDLKEGRHDDKLVYRKRLRKGVNEYTKTTPPHVKAARQLGPRVHENGMLIEYLMTKRGPEPAQIAHGIDYAHYIEKQVRSIASSVLTLLGLKFEDVVADGMQKKLTDFL